MIAAEGCCGRQETTAGQEVLGSVDLFLRRGLDLWRWWNRARVTDDFTARFELVTSPSRDDGGFGFFGVAPVEGREIEVIGNHQTMFYDRPKSPARDRAQAAAWTRDQIREFVLRYFMRVSEFQFPEQYVPPGAPDVPFWLRPLSWCPERGSSLMGFGYSQIFYKSAADGRIGCFPEGRRAAIVDLREIGPVYEWILPQVRIFDFKLTIQPFGPNTPSLTVPLGESSYLVLSPDFIIDETDPEPGVLGRYGFGYAFVKNPVPGPFGFGPGEFDAAMQTIQFQVLEDGKVRAEAAFVANRPTRVVNVPLNPVDWMYGAANLATLGAVGRLFGPAKEALDRLPFANASFDPVFPSIELLNLMTGGLAARSLCISRTQLEKSFLVTHFMQHYLTLLGSLEIWRQVPDWLDPESVPPAVAAGLTGREGRA